MSAPLLSIENLRTYFYSRSKRAFIRSVDGVSLAINPGETLGVVGESGCGKSVTALSVMGLITAAPGVIQGRIDFDNGKLRRNLLEGLAAGVPPLLSSFRPEALQPAVAATVAAAAEPILEPAEVAE